MKSSAAPCKRPTGWSCGQGQRASQQEKQRRRHPSQRQQRHRSGRLSCGDSSFKCKNILDAPSVPILFILVCFLVIANTRCDQVGSANVGATASENSNSNNNNNNNNNNSNGGGGPPDNDLDKLKASDLAVLSSKDLEALEQQANAIKSHAQGAPKHDPLGMLREIYLDHNSKIITMLMPESETVQKFHPNGRYGRRSVDSFAEPHVELGRLIYSGNNDDQQQPDHFRRGGDATAALRLLLRSAAAREHAATMDESSSAAAAVAAAHSRGPPAKYRAPPGRLAGEALAASGAGAANYQLEINKLLKCNFTGISNLYWCDAASGGGGGGGGSA